VYSSPLVRIAAERSKETGSVIVVGVEADNVVAALDVVLGATDDEELVLAATELDGRCQSMRKREVVCGPTCLVEEGVPNW